MNDFKIIGISVETSNVNNRASTDLSNLWTHFYTDKVYERIPSTKSSDVYVVYTNYESDYTDKTIRL